MVSTLRGLGEGDGQVTATLYSLLSSGDMSWKLRMSPTWKEAWQRCRRGWAPSIGCSHSRVQLGGQWGGCAGARQEQPQGQGASSDAWRGQVGPSRASPDPLLGRPAPSTLGLRVGVGDRGPCSGADVHTCGRLAVPCHPNPVGWPLASPALTRSDSTSA